MPKPNYIHGMFENDEQYHARIIRELQTYVKELENALAPTPGVPWHPGTLVDIAEGGTHEG